MPRVVWIEEGFVLQHGAGNGEQAICNGSERSGVAVTAKFEAGEDLRWALLSTLGHDLIESPGDPFWGAGAAGDGERDRRGCHG